MLHYFNVDIAAKYGMKDAVVLQSLAYWLQKNVINKNNIHDGVAWTFNSVSKMKEYFPYLTYNQLADCLRRLEKNGLIVSANYNKMGYDRTKWYTLTPYAEELTGVKVRTGGGDYGRSRATRKASAYVSRTAVIGAGAVVEPKAIVNAHASIGMGCIVSVGAIIDHDTDIGEFCHINAGAIVMAGGKVESLNKIHAGEVVLGFGCVPKADSNSDFAKEEEAKTGKAVSFF